MYTVYAARILCGEFGTVEEVSKPAACSSEQRQRRAYLLAVSTASLHEHIARQAATGATRRGPPLILIGVSVPANGFCAQTQTHSSID